MRYLLRPPSTCSSQTSIQVLRANLSGLKVQDIPDSLEAKRGSSNLANPVSRPQTISVSAAEESSTATVSRAMAPGFGYVNSPSTRHADPMNPCSWARPAPTPSTRRAMPCKHRRTGHQHSREMLQGKMWRCPTQVTLHPSHSSARERHWLAPTAST